MTTKEAVRALQIALFDIDQSGFEVAPEVLLGLERKLSEWRIEEWERAEVERRTHKCKVCGAIFVSRKAGAKYCSTAHRRTASSNRYRSRKREAKS